jgi:glycosyltransferase involved in cell wall biosynthesis
MNRILHINTEYSSKSLYKNLVSKLIDKVSHQIVYIPIRRKNETGNNSIEHKNLSFYYPYILNFFLRIRYFRKIRKIFNDADSKLDFSEIDVIHSHTLFSSGGPTYLLNRKYQVPYIITLRNTDINIFFKYLFYLKPFSYKILSNASRIIVISPKYSEHLRQIIPKNVYNLIENKIKNIPNGIDDFWFENLGSKRKKPSGEIKLLFVGELNRNKNIGTVIRLTEYLNSRGISTKLIIVGDGPKKKKIIKKSRKNTNLTYYHQTDNKEQLLKIYREADIFIMPSIKETFGLVYGEAMSQGVPVLYSRGQGIDGYFKEGGVGYSVKPKDIRDIASKIQLILDNYEEISNNCILKVQKFNWNYIADIYEKIYEECLEKKDNDQ